MAHRVIVNLLALLFSTASLAVAAISVLESFAPGIGVGAIFIAPLGLFALAGTKTLHVMKEAAEVLKHESIRRGRMFERVADRIFEIRTLCGLNMAYYGIAAIVAVTLPSAASQQWLEPTTAAGLLIATSVVAFLNYCWTIGRGYELDRFTRRLEGEKREQKHRTALLSQLRAE